MHVLTSRFSTIFDNLMAPSCEIFVTTSLVAGSHFKTTLPFILSSKTKRELFLKTITYSHLIKKGLIISYKCCDLQRTVADTKILSQSFN